MRVKQLKISNFRGIGDLTIEFDENEPTVFIGVNGVGKSSILDCLAIMLSDVVEYLVNSPPPPKTRVSKPSTVTSSSSSMIKSSIRLIAVKSKQR
ncbi:MAG: AAA family ATPase [Oscillatoria sp. PMC 1051.18]|nr:AAA family ATPase [Oscillatoria sp. PMC 1050.18]MEC5029672.1 AAA family ATPase [Oscillatoria sp. PMC 1051.18]